MVLLEADQSPQNMWDIPRIVRQYNGVAGSLRQAATGVNGAVWAITNGTSTCYLFDAVLSSDTAIGWNAYWTGTNPGLAVQTTTGLKTSSATVGAPTFTAAVAAPPAGIVLFRGGFLAAGGLVQIVAPIWLVPANWLVVVTAAVAANVQLSFAGLLFDD